MKPQAFDYTAATSVDHAIEALTQLGDDAKVLAGGQSLLPMMNFRLARPTALVDIGRVPGLADITWDDAAVTIGALATHRQVETSSVPGPLGTMLRQAGRLIGHYPIRVRGTFGGSLAHSDPASEWCQLASLLDATLVVQGPRGTREIAASDFFLTVFTTSLDYDEVLTAVRLPALDDTTRVNVEEFARRAGDFAIVAIMTSYAVRDGIIADPRLCAGGVSDVALRLRGAEAELDGQPATPEVFARAAAAAADEVNPPADLHGDGEFRRDLVRALTRRALEGAHS